jgi:hypothetical protein
MQPADPIAFADAKSRIRPRITAFAAVYFAAVLPFLQPAFASSATPARRLAWVLLATTLLLSLLPVPGWIWGRRVRLLINDEVSRAHARAATAAGFWISMLVALSLFVLPAGASLTSRQAIYVVVTPAITGALLFFSWLEWRANRDG